MEVTKVLDGSVCEGFVCRDVRGNRVKLKSTNYVALQHRISSSAPDLVRIVLSNEQNEVAAYFPHLRAQLERLTEAHKSMVAENLDQTTISERLALIDSEKTSQERMSKAEKQKQKAQRKEEKKKNKK